MQILYALKILNEILSWIILIVTRWVNIFDRQRHIPRLIIIK